MLVLVLDVYAGDGVLMQSYIAIDILKCFAGMYTLSRSQNKIRVRRMGH